MAEVVAAVEPAAAVAQVQASSFVGFSLVDAVWSYQQAFAQIAFD